MKSYLHIHYCIVESRAVWYWDFASRYIVQPENLIAEVIQVERESHIEFRLFSHCALKTFHNSCMGVASLPLYKRVGETLTLIHHV